MPRGSDPKRGARPAEGRGPGERCGATTSRGTPCRQYPVKGGTRCKRHNGMNQVHGNLSTVVHGRFAQNFRYLEDKTQALIDQALEDPHLLDVKRPIAVGQVIMQDAPLLPTDDQLRALCRARKMAVVRANEIADLEGLDEWLEPSEAEINAERLFYLDRSMQLVERFARRQADAAKQAEAARLLTEAAIPVLVELGTRLGRLFHRYIQDEATRQLLRDSTRTEIRLVVHNLQVLQEK